MTRPIIVVTGVVVALSALALGGCRREVPYHEPMKLGAASEPAPVRH